MSDDVVLRCVRSVAGGNIQNRVSPSHFRGSILDSLLQKTKLTWPSRHLQSKFLRSWLVELTIVWFGEVQSHIRTVLSWCQGESNWCWSWDCGCDCGCGCCCGCCLYWVVIGHAGIVSGASRYNFRIKISNDYCSMFGNMFLLRRGSVWDLVPTDVRGAR